MKSLKREQGCVESSDSDEGDGKPSKKKKVEIVEEKEKEVKEEIPDVIPLEVVKFEALEYKPEEGELVEKSGDVVTDGEPLKEEVLCGGCRYNSAGVRSHMGLGGCAGSDYKDDDEE